MLTAALFTMSKTRKPKCPLTEEWIKKLGCAAGLCSVMSNALWPMDCSPWGSFVLGDCPGKNTGLGCHALLQGKIRSIYTHTHIYTHVYIHQIRSVAQSCLTLCDPMNRSTPGLPVHHQLPEFTQTHVHRVIDAIQPSHPLSSPSPPAPNPSQHQSLFQWVNSSHEVAKVLEFQL